MTCKFAGSIEAEDAVGRIALLMDAETKRHQRNVRALRTRLREAKASACYYERRRTAASAPIEDLTDELPKL